MPLYDTLCEIAEQIEIEASCQGTAQAVNLAAIEKGIFGRRVLFQSSDGKALYRIDSNGRPKSFNWHEVLLFEESQDYYVIDIDSPNKVYILEDYKERCFPNQDNI